MEGRGRKTYSTVIPSKSKNEKTEFDGSWQGKKVFCFYGSNLLVYPRNSAT